MKSIRIILISLLFIVFPLKVKSQIENEIKAYVDSTEIIVNNGRKMLVKSLTEHNYPKAFEIYQYLTNLTLKKNYSAFYYSEDIYINMLMGDWNNLLIYMLDYSNKIKKTVYPDSYAIMPVLYKRLSPACDSLFMVCKKSGCDKESEKVLGLLFHLIGKGSADNEYNDMLIAFRKEYKETRYADFLNNYMPHRKIQGTVSWAIGSGGIFTTGKLSENFSSNVSFNMAMDISIQKVYASLYLNSANLKLNIPFSVTGETENLTFDKDESFHYLDAGLKAGYFIIRNGKFRFAPYGSASGSFLESRLYDTEKDGKEYRIFNSFTYGAGLYGELKITEFQSHNMYGASVTNYIGLKMETGYNVVNKFKSEAYKGNLPYASIALVWGFGDF
jgi:hypothetical protein